MKEAITRVMWTDAQKAEMLRATAGMSGDETRAYLGERGIKMQLSSLRSLGVRYKKAHPEFDPAAAAEAPVPAVKMAPGADFNSADDRTKLKLAAEFAALPSFTGAKKEWLDAHKTHPSKVYWWVAKLQKKTRKDKAHAAMKTASRELAVREPMNGSQPKRGRPPKVEILPPKPEPAITLDDAILALEVERDHMNATIQKLKHMRDGFR